MQRIESLKARHDLKIALKRTRNSLTEPNTSHGEDNPTLIKKDNVRTHLKRNLKKSFLKKALRRTAQDPCPHSGDQWYTFANPNCYNQLDEVIVEGNYKSRKAPSLNSSLVKKDNWWNKPIDVSFKNPWPEARWDWFEDRVSGNPVWGDGSGSEEFGNRIGKNSVIGKSYDMNEWVIPGGGGGNLKFWAHLDNWGKYGLKGFQTLMGAQDQGNALRNEYDKQFQEISNDTIVNITTFKPESIYKDADGKVKAVYSDFFKRDTIVNKNQVKNLQRFIQKEKIKHQNEVDDILNGKKTID